MVKYAGKNDCVKTMTDLAKEDIETDFLYEKDGESQGFEQARSGELLSLFLSATRMRWLRHRPAALLTCAEVAAVFLRKNEREVALRHGNGDSAPQSALSLENHFIPIGQLC